MDVVDKIRRCRRRQRALIQNVPVTPVIIRKATVESSK